MRSVPVLLGVLVLVVTISPWAARAADAPAAEWPGWRGPNRDGKSPDTGLLKAWPQEGPPLAWKVSEIGSGFSSVAVSAGTIYITGQIDGKLMLSAFDLAGKRKWQVPIDRAWTRSTPGSRSTPVIDTGRLYLVSGNGLVVCCNAKTGRRIWAQSMSRFGGRPGSWGYAESVLIYKNLAVVKPGGRNCIVALNKQTGRPAWASKGFDAGPEYGSCQAFTFNKAPLIAAGTRGGIVCVSARNGSVLFSNGWSRNNTANCPTPAYADGHLFWANGYGKGGICLKLKAVGGRIGADVAWTTREMDCHHGGYVLHEGHIYGNHGGGWACLELKTGQRRWGARGVGKGSLCFADGMLYLFGESGGRAALATCSPEGMEITGRVTVKGRGPSWAHPVVIGGRLYLRYDDNLYCFDVRAEKDA
jgi:outer membrane protein assembly factor BamB